MLLVIFTALERHEDYPDTLWPLYYLCSLASSVACSLIDVEGAIEL